MESEDDEMMDAVYDGRDIVDGEDAVQHIGIIRRSGRYPWGSGQGSSTELGRAHGFKAYVDEMKAKGLTDSQICEGLSSPGHTVRTTDLRAGIAISTDRIFGANQALAYRLKDKGMGTSAIAERMSSPNKKVNESTVRGWLKTSEGIKEGSLRATAGALRDHVAAKPFLDVGKGTELYMGVAESKLRTALAMLKDEGYEVHSGIKLPQLGTDKLTEYKVLTKAGVSWKDAYDAVRRGDLKNITDTSDDGGLTFKKPASEPVSINGKRVEVRFAEDGGAKMDGVIELRRGVPDLDLGASRYAQVRVAVDGTHYLKGMAIYADDMPKGSDIRFNSNKKRSEVESKFDAMKPMKDEEGNRFGATTHPKVYVDKNGKEKTSALNIVGSKDAGNEEGKWDEWSKSLSSQFLSKQSLSLASQQLGKAQAAKQKTLDEINALTNPVVRKKLLEEYADSADSAAVHLKGAALDRQSSHVILPINAMRPNEIYAPKFDNGDKVVLIRYPHGGPFEIPELTVNNKNLTAKRILSNAKDAVGIHHSVAEQLSGADFDGDSVLVIPKGKIKTRPMLEGLKNFDPKSAYPKVEGMVEMTKANTQKEMGKISNLITDMTIKKANETDIAAAVRHSMVVIDAEKKSLNYKQSELDNGIKALKAKYQGGPTKGASTIISKSSSDARVPEQKRLSGAKGINLKTGEKVFVPTGRTYVKTVTKVNKRTGESVTTTRVVDKETKGTKMEFAKDARSLLSKDAEPMEEVYASHANTMKALANQARKQSLAVKDPKISPAAKAVYSKEVESLKVKLQTAQRNAPLERRAQVIGNAVAKARIAAHPQLEKDDIKKIKFQELENARLATGANKTKVTISDREWEAIQAGAIASTRLREILNNADMERVKELATPRYRSSLTPGQLARAKQMESQGRTLSEISETLGIPRSTVSDNLKR